MSSAAAAPPAADAACWKRKAADMSRSCGVCCEEYTKLVRKPIECASCEYSACTECYKRYLTEKTDSGCMQCAHIFDREFLDASFTKAWIKGEYTQHREKILLDLELARMPTSQHLLANYRLCKDLTSQRHADTALLRDLKNQAAQVRERIDRNQYRENRIVRTRYQHDGRWVPAGEAAMVASMATPGATVRACPAKDCRGFLDESMRCGVCNVYACDKCWDVIGVSANSTHACDPGAVETAKYLRAKTRSCPQCNIPVSKISGCDQMFCVNCQTPFSWNTGEIVRHGRIHNPEFFRWMRERSTNGEIPVDAGVLGANEENACGAGPRGRRVIRLGDILRRLAEFETSIDFRGELYGVFEKINHIRDVEMTDLPQHNGVHRDNWDLRIRYLDNELSADQLKKKLVQREKKREKEIAIRQCYETLLAVFDDCTRAFAEGGANAMTPLTLLDRLREICDFVNDALSKVARRFDCKVYKAPTLLVSVIP